ncbi:hypothetical protein [Shewanella colwelliana]|uniref:hypothetical protein n=1 Tax=Shewanella colwelliana TaxID=23 RepID=UPI000AFBC32F|nr:hypothetical protein [Shewanella colwelliana]
MTMPSMSNSSAASSGTGDQANNAAFQGGNVNFGAGSTAKGIPTWPLLILCVIALAVLMKKPKR